MACVYLSIGIDYIVRNDIIDSAYTVDEDLYIFFLKQAYIHFQCVCVCVSGKQTVFRKKMPAWIKKMETFVYTWIL